MIIRLSDDLIREVADSDAGIAPEDQDEMAIPSYRHANPLIRSLMWKRYQVIHSMLAPSKTDTVLEFGCGMGLYLPTLCRDAGKVYAADLFPQYARILTEKTGCRVTFSDDLKAFPQASFDAAVAADVLEHVDDLPHILQSFRILLKPGARLLVSGPTESRLYRFGRYVAGFGGKGHYHERNIAEIDREIQKNGFVRLHRRRLPFRFLPSLFWILSYRKTGSA